MSLINANQLPQFQGAPLAERECSICTLQINAGDTALGHAGGSHIFHDHCISEWLKIYDSCPFCEFEVTHINGTPIETFREEFEIDGIEVRRSSLYLAAAEGNSAKVGRLLATGIDPESIKIALMQAVLHVTPEGNYPDVIRALLARVDLTVRERGKIVLELARQNSTLSLQYLLADGDIAQSYRGDAVCEAAKKGDLEKVEILLAHGEISQDDRGSAVIYGDDHPEIVRALLLSGTIGEADTSWCLLSAIQKSDVATVRLILQRGTLSIHDRGVAFVEAITDNKFQIAAAIYESGTIEQAVWDVAVRETRRHGHQNLARELNEFLLDR